MTRGGMIFIRFENQTLIMQREKGKWEITWWSRPDKAQFPGSDYLQFRHLLLTGVSKLQLACGLNPAHHLFLYSPWAKKGFAFFISWEKTKRRVFCDTRKLHEIPISVPVSKFLVEYSTLLCVQCLWLLLRCNAQLNSCGRGCMTCRGRNIYHLALYKKKKKSADPCLYQCPPLPDRALEYKASVKMNSVSKKDKGEGLFSLNTWGLKAPWSKSLMDVD